MGLVSPCTLACWRSMGDTCIILACMRNETCQQVTTAILHIDIDASCMHVRAPLVQVPGPSRINSSAPIGCRGLYANTHLNAQLLAFSCLSGSRATGAKNMTGQTPASLMIVVRLSSDQVTSSAIGMLGIFGNHGRPPGQAQGID